MPESEHYMVLPDGTKINLETGKPQAKQYVDIPSNTEAQALVTSARRKLVDLPDIPERMNAISCVVAYTLFGLDEDEIALALNVPVERVVAIQMLDAFHDMTDAVAKGIQQTDIDPVTNAISQQSMIAVNKVVSTMNEAEDEKLQFDAARDLLDRAGHRPNDTKERQHQLEAHFTIEMVTRAEDAGTENINIINSTSTEVIENGNSS